MTGNGLNRHSLLFFARGGSRRQVGVSMVRSDSSPALHLSGRLHECGGEPGVPGRPQSSLSQVPGPGTARPFPVRGYPSRVTHTGRTGQVDARRRTRSPAAGGQGCRAPPTRATGSSEAWPRYPGAGPGAPRPAAQGRDVPPAMAMQRRRPGPRSGGPV